MPKLKAVYVCQACGQSSSKWAGQCPDCKAWNTLVEEVVEERSESGRAAARSLTEFRSEIVALSDVREDAAERAATGLGELDRLLGGGLVRGQVLLVAGPPGIGKSTLMLHAAAALSRKSKVLYVSGEESLGQVSGRAKRLGVSGSGILLLAETDLSRIVESVKKHKPAVIILDSIQTVFHPELSGGPGSVGQVRECAAELLRLAKQSDACLFLLGHVTKEGAVAGPKVLEHIVDTVLQFDTERGQSLRVLRAQKNRFGPTSEVGLFEMREEGLRGVEDASAYFVEKDAAAAAGRAVSVAVEGRRPLLVEVQALVAATRYPLPRRMATGIDLSRVHVLVAALEKHLPMRFENQDVFVSLSGGLRLRREPAIDLAVCLALVSSAREEALPADRVFIGEVGLLGRLGRVSMLEERLAVAARAGFSAAIVPKKSCSELASSRAMGGMRIDGAEDIASAAAAVLKL